MTPASRLSATLFDPLHNPIYDVTILSNQPRYAASQAEVVIEDPSPEGSSVVPRSHPVYSQNGSAEIPELKLMIRDTFLPGGTPNRTGVLRCNDSNGASAALCYDSKTAAFPPRRIISARVATKLMCRHYLALFWIVLATSGVAVIGALVYLNF
ncbi:hypothetical protein BZA05DRAFT_422749 [Tricharina praecox]|uniref:uncharacterized protein n=1 Tax=Tricharina praecox TaxID=43433 RepID=UPI00221F9790|nr:uncharacterized protein BZA05DRAFT_422749 [Tricharina praecox]KAI5841666.1 hypothetical protein BZA05DRAFT_422749 [Tricharina praecox]